MKRVFIKILFIFLLGNFCNLTANSFVKPKKQKKVSTAVVKEQIGNAYAVIQGEIGGLLKVYGHMLEQIVDDVEILVNGSKEEFFTKAKSSELQNYRDHLILLKDSLNNHHAEIKSHCKSLENKKSFIQNKK